MNLNLIWWRRWRPASPRRRRRDPTRVDASREGAAAASRRCRSTQATPELSDNQEEHDEEFPWKTFAQLPSARLVFLDVGDVFFMRPGVYHRVFTLSAKVQLFGEFVGAATFVESLKSARADRERPHCLKACDSRITMTSLFLAGLSAELGEVDDGPLSQALSLGGLEALRAIRTLPDKYLDRCSRCLGFDADAACQQLLACPGL